MNWTIDRGIYVNLPRCSFSSRTMEPAKATSTSIRGLKTDTNRGPLTRTHQVVKAMLIPETTIPLYEYQITDATLSSIRSPDHSFLR